MGDTPDNENTRNQKHWVAIVLSTLAAAFGVQNRNNLERDFSSDSPWPYIIAGIVFTLVLVLILAAIVALVLSNI